jgi:hypothetical protein
MCELPVEVLSVISHALTSDVPSDDGLDREYTKALDKHGSIIELIAVLFDLVGHLFKVGSDQMVGHHILEEREPELADLCEKFALVGNTLADKEKKER